MPLPFKLGKVNCYLLKNSSGYILIDTGHTGGRTRLENELEIAGCRNDNLKLILLTHGDFDHTGNAAYLRRKFGTGIAMHVDDAGMVERGNIFWNRKKRNIFVTRAAALLFGFRKAARFSPDLYPRDGESLLGYGFDVTIIHIPGHSKGSIGIMTRGGDFFCGDLLMNGNKPALNSIMDDPLAANASIEKLKNLNIKTIYPGHGKPFPMERLIERLNKVGK